MPMKEKTPVRWQATGAHDTEDNGPAQLPIVGAGASTSAVERRAEAVDAAAVAAEIDVEFASLAAQYALAGHALIRNGPDDKLAPFMAMRWGWIRPLASLDEARAFLRQIGGGHGA